MFSMRPGNTRAALLIESTKPDGTKETLIYHLAEPIRISMQQQYSTLFNVFDGASRILPHYTEVTIEALMGDGSIFRPAENPFEQQKEIEPVNLALTSNEDPDIIEIDEDDIYDDLEDHWRED